MEDGASSDKDVNADWKWLLGQGLDGVFFNRLDEPIRWAGASDAEKEALLDYIYDHLRVIYANDALLAQISTTREALLGTPPRARWSHDPADWRKRIRLLYDVGQTRYTAPTRAIDGRVLMIEGEFACTYDDEGRITGHFGIQRDITERERALTALRQNAERLAMAQQVGNVGDFWLDVTTMNGGWSPQMFRIYGIEPRDTVPTYDEWIAMLHPDDRARAIADWQRIAAGEVPDNVLFRVVRGDGEIRQLNVRVVGYRDADGVLTTVRGTLHDVTELEAALRTARDRAEDYELLFSRSADAIVVLALDEPIRWTADADKAALVEYLLDHLRIIAINDAGCEQLGAPRDVLLGTTPRVRFVEDLDAGREYLRDLYDTGTMRRTTTVRRSDGRKIRVEGTYVCRYDASGRITGHFGIQRDVTERERIEQRARVTERMVSLGTLSAGIAHEINNPLAFVLGNMQAIARTLERNDGDLAKAKVDELRRLVTDALHGADRVRDIIRDLRTFARGDETSAGPVDLVEVLDLAVQLTANQVRHRARLVREHEPVPPVYGNATRLGQVFVNLMINAVQAIPADDRDHEIGLRSRREGEHVIAEVSDTGRGMAPEILARVFDPFFTTKEVGEGMGLGLSICHTILSEIGGDIRVDTLPGGGTRFQVILPIAVSAPPELAAPPQPGTSSRRRILVVDDEPLVGQLFARMLEAHEVVVETRAAEALARVERGEHFDRILCDLMMPAMNGPELYRRLPAEARTRMVFMTGGAFTPEAVAFLETVPNPRLGKPFDVDALEAVLGVRIE